MISIDAHEVHDFGAQLRRVPTQLRRGLTRRIRTSAGRVVTTIQGNYSWSSRIPGAVKTRVGFGPRSAGVLVYVDADTAPHARPLEFGTTRSGINRHPVFDPEVWVDQPIRPSFMRGIRASEPMVIREIQGELDQVFRSLTRST